MVPVAVAGVVVLWRAAAPLPPVQRLPALVFGVVVVALYTTSALYHVPRGWSARARTVLCRCDGVATLLLIVGTLTPVAYYTLAGPWRRWTLVAAACVGLVGAVVAAAALHVPRGVAALAYTAVGWLCLVPLVMIARVLPTAGLVLLALGGLLYTVGAAVFALRRPDPSPAWFGFHEVFHTFVVAATVAHFLAIWRFVLPAAT